MANPLAGSRFFARLSNVFTRPMWRLLGPPEGFAVLTTTGRKSGEPRSQSVRAILKNRRVALVAMMGERAQWLKNIRANPRVSIKLKAGVRHGLAHEVTDPAEKEWAASTYIDTRVCIDRLDHVVYEWGLPTRRNVEQGLRKWFGAGIPVIIELDDDGS
jgi:deazaflavin-dependent oxidoreductase (nitroreductase family)